jgi:hypothetical protein
VRVADEIGGVMRVVVFITRPSHIRRNKPRKILLASGNCNASRKGICSSGADDLRKTYDTFQYTEAWNPAEGSVE